MQYTIIKWHNGIYVHQNSRLKRSSLQLYTCPFTVYTFCHISIEFLKLIVVVTPDTHCIIN